MPTRLAFSLLLLATALTGCASGGAPSPEPAAPATTTQPRATTAAALLVPPASAERTAERVSLSGNELGTMWTFENPPLDYWQARYGFQATPEWLRHVRLASVRYGESCSASFVSPAGLVVTNHHCARECIEAVSTEQVDYLVEGFYAPTRDRELLCPELFLDQLVEIEDVTARVRQTVPEGAAATARADAEETATRNIESECEAATGLQCQVVSLFHGGQYRLYRYRRYAPVKLVFAPELQAGFYGGDPDNFTYPRYNLDVAFLRAYAEDGATPAATQDHFQWDADGAREGELVFVTGNPGSTSRLLTVSQVMYERVYGRPLVIQFLEGQLAILRSIAEQGPEAERRVRDQLFSVENSLKAYRGQYAGLRDSLLLGRKIRWEREFRQRVAADPALRARYGDVWDRIARIQARKLELSPRVNATNLNFLASPHLQLAGMLVRYIRETGRPEAERLEDYRGENLAEVERLLRSPIPLDAERSTRILELRLEIARQWLPADDPFIREAFQPGESPADAARRLTQGTRAGDVAYRESLLAGGGAALDTASDPLIRLARQMDTTFRQLEPRWREAQADEDAQQQRVAEALFATFGTQLPPDATFTLRITDGVVARYPYNGTVAPPHTSYYGLYERAANFNDEMPWTLPASFAERRDAVDLAVPLNFVSTNDITGGNSGSPIIDREARIVGLAFDSNIEALPHEFLFWSEAGRTVAVHSAGIIEALRNVYEADALLSELTGSGREP